jgi:hypothetical protein
MEDRAQRKRQKEIADQDRNRGKDHCLSGGPSDTFGPLTASHAFVTANDGDDAAKNEGLNEANTQVRGIGVLEHVVPQVGAVDSI